MAGVPGPVLPLALLAKTKLTWLIPCALQVGQDISFGITLLFIG
jgi:hypothetical protein